MIRSNMDSTSKGDKTLLMRIRFSIAAALLVLRCKSRSNPPKEGAKDLEEHVVLVEGNYSLNLR